MGHHNPIFGNEIEDQLDISLAEPRTEIPQDPQWGVKKNSEGKNVFWYGYKAQLAVGTLSQNILQSLFSSGNLNNGKAAIPLLKGIQERVHCLLYTIKQWMQDRITNPSIRRFIEWGIKLSLLIINVMSLIPLALINISLLLVSESIRITTIVLTRNMKH